MADGLTRWPFGWRHEKPEARRTRECRLLEERLIAWEKSGSVDRNLPSAVARELVNTAKSLERDDLVDRAQKLLEASYGSAKSPREV